MTQVYYEGDFYYCTVAASPGQSPGTHPNKWQRLAIPADLVEAVALKPAGGVLTGQEKGNSLGTEAELALMRQAGEAQRRDRERRRLKVVR